MNSSKKRTVVDLILCRLEAEIKELRKDWLRGIINESIFIELINILEEADLGDDKVRVLERLRPLEDSTFRSYKFFARLQGAIRHIEMSV